MRHHPVEGALAAHVGTLLCYALGVSVVFSLVLTTVLLVIAVRAEVSR